MSRKPAARGRPAPAADGAGRDEAAREAAAVEAEQAAAQEGAADECRPEPAPEEQQVEPAEDPLARAERERGEYLALAQRAQADFENYRKRAAKDLAAAGGRAKAAVVRELLPALDNLERALGASGEAEASLAEGVRLVHSELLAALERNGVESFEPAGEEFDPTVHEAMSTRPEDGADAGVVLDVVEKGYRLGDTVLRPARVVVSA